MDKNILYYFTGLVLVSLVNLSSATPTPVSGYCIPVSSDGSTVQSTSMTTANLADVTITKAVRTDTGFTIFDSDSSNIDPINATNCAGVFAGNDSPLGGNTGTYGDGLLNGENQNGNSGDDNLTTDDSTPHLFDEGAFITKADWQDLTDDNIDNPVDPGWLNLWKSDGNEYNSFGGLNIVDYLTIEIYDITNGGRTGEWSLTFTNPGGLLDAMAMTIFDDSFFDHLAFAFKSGNNGNNGNGNGNGNNGNDGGLVFYDFNFNILNAASGNLFDLSVPHNFVGTFDVSSILTQDISHISLYARDPSGGGSEVPAPTTLTLLSLSLFALAAFARKRRV